MNAEEAAQLAKLVAIMEDGGANIRDVEIDHEESGGIGGLFSKITGGEPPRKVVYGMTITVDNNLSVDDWGNIVAGDKEVSIDLDVEDGKVPEFDDEESDRDVSAEMYSEGWENRAGERIKNHEENDDT